METAFGMLPGVPQFCRVSKMLYVVALTVILCCLHSNVNGSITITWQVYYDNSAGPCTGAITASGTFTNGTCLDYTAHEGDWAWWVCNPSGTLNYLEKQRFAPLSGNGHCPPDPNLVVGASYGYDDNACSRLDAGFWLTPTFQIQQTADARFHCNFSGMENYHQAFLLIK
jgi:hypothetical protein